jgi:hypothetical protein
LLAKICIFSLVYHLFPLNFFVYLGQEQHDPFGKLEELIVVAIFGDFKREQEFEDQAAIMKDVDALLE